VFYTALEKGLVTLSSIVEDKPIKYGDIEYNNYDNKYLGKMTVYQALRKSRNTTAVQMLEKTGVSPLRKLMVKLLRDESGEVKKRIPDELGVALGTPVFSPLEMAQLYGAFASGGKTVTPTYITHINDKNDKLIWESRQVEPVKVMDPDSAYIILNALTGVFEPGGTTGWIAKKREQNLLQFDIAGKTGTTSHFKDAWFAGITSDEVMIVWIGTDRSRSLGRGRSGGSIAAPVWFDYMITTRENETPEPFYTIYDLKNITTESFCNLSGGVPVSKENCKDQATMPFRRGTEPDFFCPLHTGHAETNTDDSLLKDDARDNSINN